MSEARVTLLLPGYALDTTFADVQSLTQRPVTPVTFQFSDQHERLPWQAELAKILAIDTDSGQFLPSASLAVRFKDVHDDVMCSDDTCPVNSETSGCGQMDLVRADPVFLKADKDNATLIPPEQLSITEHEADSMLATLNGLVAQDGLEFFRHSSSEWYLRGLLADELRSYPPSFLANRNTSSFLPDGDAARDWRRLMTEVQMLLHSHPVNLQREQSGRMPVNSVWFWGGATLPTPHPTPTDIQIYADASEADVFAKCAKLKCHGLSNLESDIAGGLEARHTVIVDLGLFQAWLCSDIDALQSRLSFINEQWLLPLSGFTAAGKFSEITIISEDGLVGVCNRQSIRAARATARSSWWNNLRNSIRP